MTGMHGACADGCAPPFVDGRRVIDELPERLAVSAEELELVSQHLHAIVASLLGDIEESEE